MCCRNHAAPVCIFCICRSTQTIEPSEDRYPDLQMAPLKFIIQFYTGPKISIISSAAYLSHPDLYLAVPAFLLYNLHTPYHIAAQASGHQTVYYNSSYPNKLSSAASHLQFLLYIYYIVLYFKYLINYRRSQKLFQRSQQTHNYFCFSSQPFVGVEASCIIPPSFLFSNMVYRLIFAPYRTG